MSVCVKSLIGNMGGDSNITEEIFHLGIRAELFRACTLNGPCCSVADA